jgi:hypothetical protein
MNVNGIIGVNVYWNLKNVGKIGTTRLIKLINDNGFEDADIKLPSDKTAFCRAIKDFNNARGHRLSRKISDNKDCIVYGIVDEAVNKEDETLKYTKETSARFDKETSAVEAEGPLSKRICDSYESYMDVFVRADISQFLRVCINKACGVPKRPSGGIYFVPQEKVEVIESMAKIVEELHIGKVYIVRIYDGPQERGNIWESCEEEIERVVDDVFSNTKKIGKRVSALENQESKLNQMNELMGVYRDLLGKEAVVEDMVEKIQRAESFISEKMKELSELV